MGKLPLALLVSTILVTGAGSALAFDLSNTHSFGKGSGVAGSLSNRNGLGQAAGTGDGAGLGTAGTDNASGSGGGEAYGGAQADSGYRGFAVGLGSGKAAGAKCGTSFTGGSTQMVQYLGDDGFDTNALC